MPRQTVLSLALCLALFEMAQRVILGGDHPRGVHVEAGARVLEVVDQRPLGPHRTRISFLSYPWDAAGRGRGAGADLETVELEDEQVVESVQRGTRSRLYRGGRYSPTRETGVHHFHRLVASALAG